MRWIVEFDDAFEPEFRASEARGQDALLASANLLSTSARSSVGLMPTR